ncbi:hypothetical protein, partial [Acinetobacter baumannii]|uniref:hypothetical protein n=1 Tax=Acinetobacter baumannii TaxID=470 RepID=UPI00148A7877
SISVSPSGVNSFTLNIAIAVTRALLAFKPNNDCPMLLLNAFRDTADGGGWRNPPEALALPHRATGTTEADNVVEAMP